MQNVSSFHQFILEIQQILDHHHAKIIKVTFGFSEFLSIHQKYVYCIHSILRESILESWDQSGHTHFGTHPSNIFQSTFNIHESASWCTKTGFSSFCCRDIADLKILQSGWMRAFCPYVKNQIFPEYGIC